MPRLKPAFLGEDTGKILLAVLSAACLVIILLLPLPQEIRLDSGVIALTREGKAGLAVLCMVVLLWITEAVPFPIAGFFALVALVMTKAAPLADLVRDGFGNPIIIFFIAVLFLSAAISSSGLLKRLTLGMLRRFGGRPKLIILLFLGFGSLLSGWITDMAVAAVLTPLALGILRDAGLKPRESRFGRALMISCAWGPLIGGISTPAGCGPNPLTVGFLKDLAGLELQFVDWMAIGVPAMLLMVPVAWLILLMFFPVEKVNLSITDSDLQARRSEIGALTAREVFTAFVFLLTVFLWVAAPWIQRWTGGAVDYLDISFVGIACSILLFLPGIRVLKWKQAEKFVSWGGIILVATGLSVGMTLFRTGAADWLAWVLFNRIGDLGPVVRIFLVVLGVSLMKVMFSSNTVTGIIVVPLLIALAGNLGLNPVALALPAGITSSLAFILVTSTPTNVIPYSTGHFSIPEMAKAGLLMTLASSLCVTLSVWIFGRLFNLIV